VYVVHVRADDEVWEFEMEESGDCVNAIQDQLSRQGIQGRKTTMAAAQQLERARDIVAEVRLEILKNVAGFPLDRHIAHLGISLLRRAGSRDLYAFSSSECVFNRAPQAVQDLTAHCSILFVLCACPQAERKGRELSECPTLERVQEIMDMYREATEKFAAVSNEKHQVGGNTPCRTYPTASHLHPCSLFLCCTYRRSWRSCTPSSSGPT
jgi:hypothetical protein